MSTTPVPQDREWLVYIDETYYPSAQVVRAPTGAEAIRRIDSPEFDSGPDRPLVIAVPLGEHATNRVGDDNAWRWDQLRDADR